MNIHGYCPHCKADLDGDVVINTAIEFFGYNKDEALAYAAMFAGWNEHGEANRWGRAIAFYDFDKDRTTAYRCPDCNETWERK